MKKLVSIIVLFAMILTLAACRAFVDPVTEPTAEPTEATPTAEPTAIPTPEPTIELTPEPTPTPEPVDLDFRVCAEEIAKIPMGNGEHEARIEYEGGVWVPEHYCVSSGMVYIYNGYAEHGAKISVLIYDTENGSIENRLFGNEYFILTDFAVKDRRMLITPDFIFDLETGEVTSLQRLIPEGGLDEAQRLIAMRVVNGKCYAYVGESMDPFLSRAIDEYELDEENLMWTLRRRVTEPVGGNGFKAGDAEFSIGEVRYFSNPTDQDDALISGRYLGTNAEGEHFVNYRYCDDELGREFDAVIRFAADGTPVSRVRIDTTALYTDDNCSLFNMDGDGNIYFMAEDDEYLTVYRVGTEIRAYELAFEDCSEIAVRLDWGNGENRVFVEKPTYGVEDDDWVIPQHFNIIDGKVYVLDKYYHYGNSILECGPEFGDVTRFSPDLGDYDFYNCEFAVMDGMIIFPRYIFDLETGEHIQLQPLGDYSHFPGDGVLFMNVRDGKCFAYRAVMETGAYGEQYVFVPGTKAYDEYELDIENRMWVLKSRISMPPRVPHASPELSEGSNFYTYDRYLGTDDAGNHYVDSLECIIYPYDGGPISGISWHRLIKFAPDGRAVSYVDVYYPDDYIHMWVDENLLIYKVDGDGTVWYMCETEDEFLIYKISL